MLAGGATDLPDAMPDHARPGVGLQKGFRVHPVCRQRGKRLSKFAHWNKALASVRRAKTDDKAIEALEKHFNMALTLFVQITTQDLAKKIRRERVNENAKERAEAMAHAMADASERTEEWKEFIIQARALDAALHVRRMYET